MYNVTAYMQLVGKKHLYTCTEKTVDCGINVMFHKRLQKKAAICTSVKQQRACICSKKHRQRTEATTPSPNNRHFYFALIKYEVLKPCGEELTRWREASFWRNRRPGPGQKCEHVRVRLRGYLQAVRNRK